MALEAMDAIAVAEEKARQIKLVAAQDGKKALQEAERAAQIVLAAAEAKADAEVKALQHKADEKATVDAQVLASNTRNRKAAMKARAERKMDEAVSKVVERIVKG